MNKLKLSLALIAAYCAGELVTTAMQIRKLNKAFDDGALFERSDVSKIKAAAYVQGVADGLADPQAVKQAHENHSKTSSTILDYTNV